MEKQPIVTLQHVTKVIGNKKIIDDLSLDLWAGQITGFLGPNGAGKTTTIRMMTGLMKTTSGEIFVEGQAISTHFEESMSKVGVIVENPEMYKYMSGYKNLVHFARMNKNVSKERINEVIAQVGLQNRIQEKVSTYSLGMRQRLGLAQALLHRPKFLILDEPTNGLDPAGIREFRMYLRKIAMEDGVSIFVSSHLLAEMELMCDRIAVIQNGKLISIKEVKEEQESHYYVEVSPKDQAIAFFTAKSITVEPQENGFVIPIETEEVPALVAEMVARNLQVYSLNPYRKTLEDQFLEMTGGGQIAESHTK
ncbi:ABC transporter ATP-binding protein [Bacillus sp. FJAT-22090]|uniref:ABC transporter ATP-binding protein n=1 Tax=Bacillus sp. FJAT-22090 TaxID=1581038 RepID=UPI00119E7A82|nr:ABC transporter ATP-binding protein [Bacillus sp. FJAT-22090]